MTSAILQVKPSFFEKFSESCLYVSTGNYEYFLVTRGFCVAAQESTFCSLKPFEYHNLLSADKNRKNLPEKLGHFCFNFYRLGLFYSFFN